MNINIHNYEAYFLDYHEGNLAPALVKELMDFLARHPELKSEFEGFEPVTLNDAEGVKFDTKELLKKSSAGINESNFDEYAIQQVEGTLPTVLQNELKEFIRQNLQYKKELELYAKTKLVPDTSIIFEDKFLLKKGSKRPAVWFYWSAAASVAVIIVSYFLLSRNSNPTPGGNNIVKQNIKPVDTTPVIIEVLPNTPLRNAVKNNRVVVNSIYKKKHREIATPNNPHTTSFAAIKNSSLIYKSLPVMMQESIPFTPENSLEILNLQDTTLMASVIKSNHTVYTQPDSSVAYEPVRTGQGKLFYLLAKYTCIGLHKITGQHINIEKKYDSDTTNVIAYQLDLGKAKIRFPVKE